MYPGSGEKGPLLTLSLHSHRLLVDFGFGRIGLETDVPKGAMAALGKIAPGCSVVEDGSGSAVSSAHVSLQTTPDGYHVLGAAQDLIESDLDTAVLWAFSAALQTYCQTTERSFVLNAGAVLVRRSAVVFAGASHAGKSSIALHLAAAGLSLLGDDRILITSDDGVLTARSTGLSRKIRVPLPVDFSPSAIALALSQRVGRLGDADVLAFNPPSDTPAGGGAPIERIVLIERGGLGHRTLKPSEAAVILLPLVGCHAGTEADLVAWIVDLALRCPVDILSAPTSADLAQALMDMA